MKKKPSKEKESPLKFTPQQSYPGFPLKTSTHAHKRGLLCFALLVKRTDGKNTHTYPQKIRAKEV